MDGVFGVRKLVWWLPTWQLSHSPNNHLLVRNPPRNKLRKDSFLDFPTIECGIFLVTLLNFGHLIKVTVAFSLGPPTEWAESLSGIGLYYVYCMWLTLVLKTFFVRQDHFYLFPLSFWTGSRIPEMATCTALTAIELACQMDKIKVRFWKIVNLQILCRPENIRIRLNKPKKWSE